MALTIIEAAKLLRKKDPLRATIIEIYAKSTDILRVMLFENILGNSLTYNIEESLPGIGFRGVNEGYSESVGILNPKTEVLVIAGGDLDVDKHITRTMGKEQRAVHEAMKVKALALNWALKFIKGDSSTTPKEFDGLQVRLTGNQLIDAGATSGGDALSLLKLDELIDAVTGATHLIMNKTMRRRLSASSRDSSVAGNIHWEKDDFGRQVAFYNDLPILIADEDNTGSQILPFTEASPGGGGSVSTSVYCTALGDQKLHGIQSGIPMVTDLGELDSKPCERTRVEWDTGLALWHPKSAARLRGIKNAAVVA